MRCFFVRFGVSVCALLILLGAVLVTRPLRADDSQGQTSTLKPMFQSGRLAIETQDGRSLPFAVELAYTRAEQERGLMFRKSIAPDHGMLFDFHAPRSIAMWMSNTYIPLDMLFADGEGRIIHIAQHTKPLSEKLIMAKQPVRYVLEVAAGTTERLHLQAGDRLHLLQ